MVVLALLAEAAMLAGESGQAVAVVARSAPASAQAEPVGKAAVPGPAEAADEASARLMARLQGRRIEVLSERAADSSTFVQPDGSLTTEAYAGPVRVRRADGSWKQIDTTLQDTGPDLRPNAAAANVAVSDGGDKSLASVTQGSRTFGLNWASTLPAPRIDGNTAHYALDGGASLTVEALAQGFEQSVVLSKAPTGPVSYRIPLTLKGLSLTKDAATGHLMLKDPAGKLVADAPAPHMWDSSLNRASGEPGPPGGGGHPHRDRRGRGHHAGPHPRPGVLRPGPDLPGHRGPLVHPGGDHRHLGAEPRLPRLPAGLPGAEVGHLRRRLRHRPLVPEVQCLQVRREAHHRRHHVAVQLLLGHLRELRRGHPGQADHLRSGHRDDHLGHPPSTTTDSMYTNGGHWGYSSACPATWSYWTLTGMVQDWADGAANYGIQLRSADEADSGSWRRFRSANYTTGGYAPKLVVNYNTMPSQAILVSPVTGAVTNDSTPTLQAKATDADGDPLTLHFEVWNSAATAMVTSGDSLKASSGTTAAWTAPALAQGTYKWRALARDGTDGSPTWPGWNTLTVDTTAPAATTISSSAFPADVWSGTADRAGNFSGSFTFTPPTSGASSVQYQLDGGAWTTVATTGAAVSRTLTFRTGTHTINAHTKDVAGNTSADRAYTFGAGEGGVGVEEPRDGAWSTGDVVLSASGASSATGASWQYRRGSADAWHQLPVSDVVLEPGGGEVSAWPVAVTGGRSTKLRWHLADTLGQDGTVQLRASLSEGAVAGFSSPVSVTLDSTAASAPQQEIGPGSVNLVTGDYSVSATDASVFYAAVSRTFSSRAVAAEAEGQAAVFGPGWVSSEAATTGVEYTKVRKTSATSVSLMKADGSSVSFTLSGSGAWTPQPGAEDLTLSGAPTGSTLTLTSTKAGTVSTFTMAAGTGVWNLTASRELTRGSTTTVVSEPVTANGVTLARPKYLVSPNSAVDEDNATCSATPATRGCRVLEFVYATATTATASTLGDYSGQVKQLKVWLTDPGASSATATVVGQYAYDAGGLLREAWDPRISPAQKNTYTYDSARRVLTYTPPGELTWTFSYSTGSGTGAAPAGTLLAVSRPTLKEGSADVTDGGTSTTSLVYNVPLSGSSAPYRLDAATVATWGQHDLPVSATAVFPADQIPASHDGGALGSGDYRRATITYIDSAVNAVNVAEPGGHISTTENDQAGNQVRELSAANRELALGLTTAGDPVLAAKLDGVRGSAGTAAAADLLSEATTYTVASDGTALESESWGPLHTVTLEHALAGAGGSADLAVGAEVLARAHTAQSYDEGRPSDAAVAHLVTSSTSGAMVEGYPVDADAESTATVYDWATGLPLKDITDPSGEAVTTTVGYDAEGRPVTASLPGSDGSSAGTSVTTYWSGGAAGTCTGHPEWNGSICTVTPAGAITGTGTNPARLVTKAYTYGRWGQIITSTETANGITRTTTSTYDGAARPTGTAVTGGSGTAVPASTVGYDATGLTTSITADGRTIVSSVDRLGRSIGYDDGNGNLTRTAYDALGRLAKVTDSAPSTVSYTYDTESDPRGVPTSVTDSVAGTFSGNYDADGDLVQETLPGGYRLTVSRDSTGVDTSRVYADAAGTLVLSDTVDRSVTGRVVGHAQTDGVSSTQSYAYDRTGHLVRTQEDRGTGCTTRAYTFDGHSNRTRLDTTVSGAACAATDADSGTGAGTTTGVVSSYDSADRLVGSTAAGATAPVYDAFGRTATAVDGSGLEYFSNDLIRQVTSGSSRQSWQLDANQRLASSTVETKAADGTWGTSATFVNHYAAESDTPSWATRTTGGTTSLSRNVADLGSGVSATTGSTGGVVLQLSDIHGDIDVRLPLDGAESPSVQHFDEYGNPVGNSTRGEYGWLGTSARAAEAASGRVLLGVRLYDPATGMFLQNDPVEGGGANAYGYCSADPVNCTDTTGTFNYRLIYTLGNPHESLNQFFRDVRSNFDWVFPIPGHSHCLCRVGQNMNLRPKVWGISLWFPVVVRSISTHGWRFDTRWGHPDWPGFISFYFYRRKNGEIFIKIHGNVPMFSDAWWLFSKGDYVKRAKATWKPFVSNLQRLIAQIRYYRG